MNGNGKLRQVSIARSRLRLWWTTSAIPQPQHHQHHQHQHGPRANISRTEAPAEHHNIVRTFGDSSGYIWNHPSNHPSKLIVHEMSKYINKSRMKALTNQVASSRKTNLGTDMSIKQELRANLDAQLQSLLEPMHQVRDQVWQRSW